MIDFVPIDALFYQVILDNMTNGRIDFILVIFGCILVILGSILDDLNTQNKRPNKYLELLNYTPTV